MIEPPGESTVNRDTRDQIILSAERLFGEFGIDAVSLRQINIAAGQRNNSAAHYHFGSKETLIADIFDYRMKRINRRRMQRLNEMLRAGQFDDVRMLVGGIILPMVEEIEQSEGGSHFIRFAAQTFRHPQLDSFSLWRSKYSRGLQRIHRALKVDLPDVPAIVLARRFGMIMELIVHSLADRELFRMSAEKSDDFNTTVFVNNLVDACTGALSAPVSSETQLEIVKETRVEPGFPVR